MEGGKQRAILASLAVAAIFSAHYVAAKIVLQSLSAPALAATRGLAGGLFLAIVFRKSLRAHLRWQWLPILLAIAALGFFCNQLLLFAGLRQTTPANVALISVSIPIVSTLLAMLTGVDAWSGKRIAGVLLGIVVVGWYLHGFLAADLAHHLTGNFLVLGNVFCFSIALLLIKKFTSGKLPPAVVSTCMLLFGGVGLWLYGGDFYAVAAYAGSSVQALALLVFEAVVTTALAYSLNVWALQRLSVASTTVFNYFQPPITVLLTWFLLGETPSWQIVLAFVGVVAACILVLSGERRQIP